MFALFVITMLFIHPMHKPCKSTLKQTVKKLEPKMTNHFIFRFNGKILSIVQQISLTFNHSKMFQSAVVQSARRQTMSSNK